MKTISGIYKIVQISQQRVIYVGSTQNIMARLRWHFGQLRRGNHNNRYLQNVWNKYGADDFKLEQVEEVLPSNLVEREQYWMDLLKPLCNPMTADENGAGWRHGPESLDKISVSSKGRLVTPEENSKRSASLKAYYLEHPEARQAISDRTKGNKNYQGHKHSEEYKHRMSELGKGYMKTHPERAQAIGAVNRGKNMSIDARRKLSESAKGRRISPETRKKISEAGKGRIVSAETRKKLGNINRGRPMSDEQKKKISLAMTGKKRPPFSEEHKRKLREVLRKANEKRFGNKND